MNALMYAAREQAIFTATMKQYGYETMTTFFGDLSIAEATLGADGVRDTFARSWTEWKENYKYLTELIVALNHKIWEQVNKDMELAKVYDELWRKADNDFYTLFADNEEAKDYYFRVTD